MGSRHLTTVELENIALLHVAGRNTSEIAQYLGCTSATVDQHLQSGDMAQYIRRHAFRFRVLQLKILSESLEDCQIAQRNVRTILNSPEHKEHGITSRWQLDKLIPNRSIVQTEATNTNRFSAEVETEILETLKSHRAALATGLLDATPHVKPAREALPATLAHRGNGSEPK